MSYPWIKDSAITISKNSGLTMTPTLQLVSDTYFNNGFNNMSLTINSNSYNT
jgi:hypothetical protein